MFSNRRGCLTVLALTFALTASARADLIWFGPFRDGNVPPDAFAGGHEANGEPLYVCRAKFNNGEHAGKIRPGFDGCHIGYGGNEESVPTYDVLVQRQPKWVGGRDGSIPPNAIGVGQEHGIEIFVCRGRFQGGVHVGKIQPAFRACNIGFGGREEKIDPYEVLVSH